MNGLPYYKAYPRDFIEGTVGMSFELKGAYRLVLDLIYMQGGQLPDDARYIAGLLGCSVRAWRKYREQLLSEGKIYADAGVISNFRADKELETVRTLQENQSKNRSRPNKNKDLPSPKKHQTPTIQNQSQNQQLQPRKAETAQASQTDEPTPRDRYLAALGLDHSGLTGHGSARLGTETDMATARRWTAPESDGGLGLTVEECTRVIAELRQRMSSPPRRFSYFDGAMADLAAAKAAPAHRARDGPKSPQSPHSNTDWFRKIAKG